MIYFSISAYCGFFLHILVTVSICKVGGYGLETYQAVTNLKRPTTVEFTAIAPILYIHCYAFALLFFVYSEW